MAMTCACTALGEGEADAGIYSDVAADAWYAEAVKTLGENGIMNGTGEGLFSPGDMFTRAQLATVLYRMEGEPQVTGEDAFTDTKSGEWYSDAVLWASQNNVVNGYGGGVFGTNDPVTQEQLVAMLWRMKGKPTSSGTADDASSWAADAVKWVRTNGLADGAELGFSPKSTAVRAQVAVICQRYMALEDTNGDKNDVLIIYFSAANTKDPDAVSAATPLVDGQGATEWMANTIADATGGDIVKIVPSEDYPLSYNDLADHAKSEADNDARPAIEPLQTDPASYKTVYIGYPIWWYTMPKVMETFFDTYDLSGVTIIPFNTHEGSRDGGTYDMIKQREPNAAVLEGLAVRGDNAGTDSAEKTVTDWIEAVHS